ncbi:ribonuclease S-7-like [Nicotiana tomentosiformis]|uniref:ribonuclease S-7-like n=1 Tax=Nicotiana tomentosiformis TaxID=4098 RepID=UPI00051C45A3|nr:ribonuclease S-7-like [Nicotiana tomentosiformis]
MLKSQNMLVILIMLFALSPVYAFDYLLFVLQWPPSFYIKNKLYERWPDLLTSEVACKQGQSFWKDQYIKHGTCCASSYNQEQYFNLTIKLKDRFDLLETLENHRIIKPGSTTTSNAKQIRNAIATVTKVFPSLKCFDIQGTLYLEVANGRSGADMARVENV